MGPDEDSTRLCTGSLHSSDWLSMLFVPTPSKRQDKHPNPREWESPSSQCHSKWNEGAASQTLSPLRCFGGVFCHSNSNRNGANLKYKAEDYRAQSDGNHWAHGNIRKSWLLQYRLKYKWILQREIREAEGGGKNRVSETSSLTKAKNTGSWGDTKYLESSSVCLLHN